jgi:hypothetical protein
VQILRPPAAAARPGADCCTMLRSMLAKLACIMGSVVAMVLTLRATSWRTVPMSAAGTDSLRGRCWIHLCSRSTAGTGTCDFSVHVLIMQLVVDCLAHACALSTSSMQVEGILRWDVLGLWRACHTWLRRASPSSLSSLRSGTSGTECGKTCIVALVRPVSCSQVAGDTRTI